MHVLRMLGESKYDPRATAFVGLRDAARRRDNNKLMVPRYKSEGPERPRRRGSHPIRIAGKAWTARDGAGVPFAYRRSTDCASAPRRNRNRTDASGSGRAFIFDASFICDNGPARCGLS